jgi:hypothetical protein
MMSDQGISAVSDSGVSIVSRAIEDDIRDFLSTANYPNFETATFGVSYESEREYILFTVTEKADTTATQAFVWNTFTRSWTKWVLTRVAGFVSPSDDKLYLAGTDDFVRQERKAFDITDYADDSTDVTISTSSVFTVTLSDASSVSVNQSLVQGTSIALITAISGNDLTVNKQFNWTAGAAVVNDPIAVKIKWLPQDAENPGIMKRWRELMLVFRVAKFANITAKFTTNYTKAIDTVTMESVDFGAWGSQAWDTFAWGGGDKSLQTIRTFFGKNTRLGIWTNIELTVTEANAQTSLAGVTLVYEATDTRQK